MAPGLLQHPAPSMLHCEQQVLVVALDCCCAARLSQPHCLFHTSHCSMADNIHAIISGEGGPPPVFEWVMLGISLLMCVVGALFVSYSIK